MGEAEVLCDQGGSEFGRVRSALTGENNSGFAEPLATGKQCAPPGGKADKAVSKTNHPRFVLNSGGLRGGSL